MIYQEKLLSRVVESGPINCWLWGGILNRDGYGQSQGFKPAISATLTHRISYELFAEKITEGHEIDHLCKNRACLNPGHLEVVTHFENQRRGASFSTKNAMKKRCKRGHLFDLKNTYIYPNSNYRACRACTNARFCRVRHNQNRRKQP